MGGENGVEVVERRAEIVGVVLGQLISIKVDDHFNDEVQCSIQLAQRDGITSAVRLVV